MWWKKRTQGAESLHEKVGGLRGATAFLFGRAAGRRWRRGIFFRRRVGVGARDRRRGCGVGGGERGERRGAGLRGADQGEEKQRAEEQRFHRVGRFGGW